MCKKLLILITLAFTTFISGCNKSKAELIEENASILEENKKLETENSNYENIDKIFDFYNSISTKSVNSFVLIESRHIYSQDTSYCDGIVIGVNGYDYYILTDYNKLWVSNNIRYRVMDAQAQVYDAQLYIYENKVLYDEVTGMAILRARVVSVSSSMESIRLGDVSDIVAHISSENQLNKINILRQNEVDECYYKYNEVEYKIYKSMLKNSGAFINSKNQACGFYLTNLKGYAGYELIKKVAYATYSLTL